MKTIIAATHEHQKLLSSSVKALIPAMVASVRTMLALIVAGLAAIAIITLSIWAAGLGIYPYLGALSWGLGFIFLGVAVDNRGPVAKYQMMTGIAMLVLALLQSSVSADLIIVSAILPATWLAVLLFKRLAA
jgi:hypothetical protein